MKKEVCLPLREERKKGGRLEPPKGMEQEFPLGEGPMHIPSDGETKGWEKNR